MATKKKPCFGVQSYGTLLEDWIPYARRDSLAEARAGLERALAPVPGQAKQPREKFRIVEYVRRNSRLVAMPIE
jgi:hypothetical protein